jgi:hypothetical protein
MRFTDRTAAAQFLIMIPPLNQMVTTVIVTITAAA